MFSKHSITELRKKTLIFLEMSIKIAILREIDENEELP
jgi:hypothetical protein